MERPLEGRCPGRRVVLGTLVLLFGVLWWWAVLRLALVPQEAGPVEGAVAAGGWGLSLLPVHVAGRDRVGRVRAGSVSAGARVAGSRATRAWRRRRSGGGSGPS
ncbi:hypothetical protein ACIP93_12995 [Streptomyces sp. NPDC088745]|uniref:hypothetical protein n=1 Tax=Streptomyces sp. NPDC088745 TaxID=3365884 RepID=UPI0037FCFA52